MFTASVRPYLQSMENNSNPTAPAIATMDEDVPSLSIALGLSSLAGVAIAYWLLVEAFQTFGNRMYFL